MSTGQPVNRPASSVSSDQPINSDSASSGQPSLRASVPLWCLVALPVTWFLNLKLLLTHDPLSRALQLGADLAKEQALKAIPQDWMGWLAQPVIQLINEYVTPYAITGKALMASWALLLGVIIPASVAVLAFLVLHFGLRLTGGAPGGWRAPSNLA